jgi:hypothetical protein
MPIKLSTTINNTSTIPNWENQVLVKEFYEFMKNSEIVYCFMFNGT